MPELETTPSPTTTKRTRKAPKKRTPRVKDEAILAIEAQAKAAKDEYRKSQASGGVLKRILEKMMPRLTLGDRERLYDALSKIVTPALTVETATAEDWASNPPRQHGEGA